MLIFIFIVLSVISFKYRPRGLIELGNLLQTNLRNKYWSKVKIFYSN